MRILSGNIQLSVSVDGEHQPGGTFHKVISAHIQVDKRQLAVSDFRRGYQPVFLQNGQVIGIPAAVGEDSGVPDRLSVGIGDFAVVHNTGHAVRLRDILSGVQIVHSTFQRSISVAARSQIPRGVQVYFGERDITKDTVILHLVGIGVHGVGIIVVGNAGGVCGVGLICIAAAKGDGDHTLAGVDKGAAAVGRGNVGVIIRVSQPNRLTVQRFGNFKGIRPFAQHGTGCAGSVHNRPITVVPAGCAALHDDKLALVALGIEQIIRTACIVAVVDDLISAATLAFNFVLVISACRNIALPDGVPRKNLKLGIALDALLCFAVDFINADLDRPLIVLHFVVVAAICRNCNSLVASQRAGRAVKTVRDGDLVIAECNIGKLRPR